MNNRRLGPLEAIEVIGLWSNGAPGMPDLAPIETVVDRSTDASKPNRSINGIVRPRLSVDRPATPNGTAVIAMPGGGYERLAVDKEAFEITPFLVDRGYTVFTLLYRLPGEGWAARNYAPLADAQRAVRLVRSRAHEFGIETNKVVVLGFSAGGHVAGTIATLFDHKAYEPFDAADALSARPDYAALIYPVQEMTGHFAHAGSRALLLGPHPSPFFGKRHTIAYNVTKHTPPFFLVHAEDDQVVAVDNTLLLRKALKAAEIPVETHLYVRGGHGFGICDTSPRTLLWHHRFIAWMIDQDLLCDPSRPTRRAISHRGSALSAE